MTTSSRLLLLAGLVTWAIAGASTIGAIWSGDAAWEPRTVGWSIAYAAFVVAFAAHVVSRTQRGAVWMLLVQSAAALVVLVFGRGDRVGLSGMLLAVVAGQLPFAVSTRAAFVWVTAQTAAMFALDAIAFDRGSAGLVGFVGFQLFALGAAHVARREMAARAELALTHAELLGTQALLAGATREAERLRISRELHDSTGHHLTALALQLEVAKNAEGERVAEAVTRARKIASELLVEVRQVVRDMRETRHVDLASALRALESSAPGLRVEVRIAPDVAVDAETAHALFRCAQEAITNALRHADAQAMTIAVEEKDGLVELRARDDGRGATKVVPGAGLTGLGERLELLGGTLDLTARTGEGFVLVARVPSRGAP